MVDQRVPAHEPADWRNKVVWLRLSYWWGIILDGVMAFLYFFPALFLKAVPVNLTPGVSLTFGLLNGAPLMIGWTILLLWADRRPVERRDILALTLPVVVGFMLLEIYCISLGITTFMQILPLLIAQTCGTTLFMVSYVRSRDLAAG